MIISPKFFTFKACGHLNSKKNLQLPARFMILIRDFLLALLIFINIARQFTQLFCYI